MRARDLEMFAALTIFSGTLVMGLDQYAIQSVSTPVTRVQDTGQTGGQDTGSGMTPLDSRDSSRMDSSRQSSFWQGSDLSRSRSAGPLTSPQPGPIEYDARRDNSRLDSRYDSNLLVPAPSNVNAGR